MLGPECGRDGRFTLHLLIVARWDEPDPNFSSCALVGAAGASHPALLLQRPLNSCLCVSSLVSHQRCSSLPFFFSLFFWHFLFFISYFLPLCCPCPFTTPTSHTPLLKDGGGVALCACGYHLDPRSVKTLIRFLSFVLPPTSFCPDYTAQVCFHVFKFSFSSRQLQVLASHY